MPHCGKSYCDFQYPVPWGGELVFYWQRKEDKWAFSIHLKPRIPPNWIFYTHYVISDGLERGVRWWHKKYINQLVSYLQYVIVAKFLYHNFGTPFAHIKHQNNDKKNKNRIRRYLK